MDLRTHDGSRGVAPSGSRETALESLLLCPLARREEPLPKARPDDSVASPPAEIVHQVGTLCFKTTENICVMNAFGDFWYLEYRPGSVQSHWREGLLVKVFYTDEFRKKVVAMEECLDDPPDQEAARGNTQFESA